MILNKFLILRQIIIEEYKIKFISKLFPKDYIFPTILILLTV